MRAQIIPVGTGMNTDSLVGEAIVLASKAISSRQPYSEIWCVFDRDSFPPANYQRAFEMARSNNFRVAWTNEAFEFWYLLHFNYCDTALGRDAYSTKLIQSGLAYDKSDTAIYEKIKEHQARALKFASRLERHWNEMGERFPERQNPSTGVHKLVEFLNELAALGSVD
jgi:hypothetical protein